MRIVSLGLTTLLVTGCALNPAPVPVLGDSRDISSLAGEWVGDYQGRDNGRNGSILFRLAVGTDTAHGDVVMVPRASTGYKRDDAESRAMLQNEMARNRLLTIRFVRVSGGLVSGAIEPYPSPDCECTLLTTFRGALRENRIEGTFITQHVDCEMPPERGTWWAERGRGW